MENHFEYELQYQADVGEGGERGVIPVSRCMAPGLCSPAKSSSPKSFVTE